MAASGSTNVTVTSYDTLQFLWSQSSQNVANNTTTISWSLKLIAGTYGAIYSSPARNWSVTINGTTYSGSASVAIDNNETKTLASGSTTISHNADGTKTFSYSFSQDFQITFSGTWIGTKTGSGSGVLNTIPRATSPSVSPTTIEMGGKVTISMPRASSSFTHDLSYSIAGSSYTSIATGQGVSYTWTVPDLSSSLPKAERGTLTIRCITKNGSTTIGTKTCSLTVIVPSSVVPSISNVTVVEGTDGIANKFGAFVQTKSTLKVTFQSAGAAGSSITSWFATFNGKQYSTPAIKNGSVTFNTSEISESGSLVLAIRVIDSRGRYVVYSQTITVLPYFPPRINSFSAWRIDPFGDDDDEGTRIALGMNFEIAEVGEKNDRTYNLKHKTSSDEDFTSFDTGTASWTYNDVRRFLNAPVISMDSAYVFRLEINDYFQTVFYEFEVPTAFTLMDFRSTGKGMAIGKVSEKDEFEIGMDADFQAGMKVNNVPIIDHVIEEGTDGVWTYRKWASGIYECWGEYSGSVSINNHLSGAYYSDGITVNYPITFSEPANFTVSGGSNDRINWARKFAENRTNQAVFIMIASEQQSSAQISVNLYARGRWK